MSENYNLVQSVTGIAFTGSTTHNLLGLDPLLGPLTNNGGMWRTCALRGGSPAIDQGKSFGPTADQRGAPRVFDFNTIANVSGGDGTDIGAVELGQPLLAIQQTANYAVVSWPSFYGDFTLQFVADLNASNSWANVAGTPAVIGNQNVLTDGPMLGKRFYRLKNN